MVSPTGIIGVDLGCYVVVIVVSILSGVVLSIGFFQESTGKVVLVIGLVISRFILT